jgi:hypothetical protein
MILKKLCLLPTVLFIDAKASDYRKNLLQKITLLGKDNWSHFKVGNYVGRSRMSETLVDTKQLIFLETVKLLGTGELSAKEEEEVQAKLRSDILRRIQHYMALGEVGRAFKLVKSSATLATSGEDTLEFLKQLHKTRGQEENEWCDLLVEEYISIPVDERPECHVDGKTLAKYVAKLPKGARHDNNLSADILKVLCSPRGGAKAEELCNLLGGFIATQFFNKAYHGTEQASYFYGSELMAIQLRKKRGLAMNDIYRKLAGMHFNAVVRKST